MDIKGIHTKMLTFLQVLTLQLFINELLNMIKFLQLSCSPKIASSHARHCTRS
jgi:hypothetical protein